MDSYITDLATIVMYDRSAVNSRKADKLDQNLIVYINILNGVFKGV